MSLFSVLRSPHILRLRALPWHLLWVWPLALGLVAAEAAPEVWQFNTSSEVARLHRILGAERLERLSQPALAVLTAFELASPPGFEGLDRVMGFAVLKYFANLRLVQSEDPGEIRRLFARLRQFDTQDFVATHQNEFRLFRAHAPQFSLSTVAASTGFSPGTILARLYLFGFGPLDHTPDSRRFDNPARQWNRTIEYLGEERSELEVLVHLSQQGHTATASAAILKMLFPIERSAKEVENERLRLGLGPQDVGHRERRQSVDLFDPHYGYLKKDGRPVASAVLQVIADDPQASPERLSWVLGVSPARAALFLAAQPPPFARGLQRYLIQMRGLSETLATMAQDPQQHGQIPPRRDQFRTQLQPDFQEFCLNLYHLGQKLGVRVRLSSATFRTPLSAATKKVVRAEIFETLLLWSVEQGSVPSSLEIKKEPRLASVAKWMESPELFAGDAQNFWLAFYDEAHARGFDFRLSDAAYKKSSLLPVPLNPRLATLLRQELFAETLPWVRRLEKLPTKEDFERHFRVNYIKLMKRRGLFANGQDFWVQFHHYARAQGFAIRLSEINFRKPLLPALETILLAEAQEAPGAGAEGCTF